MTKKIITAIIFVIIFIALTFGGIRRTMAVYDLSQVTNSNLNAQDENQPITFNSEPGTLVATVETIQADIWVFRLEDGRTLEVEGRAVTYMSSLGFAITQGQQVSLQVFSDANGTLEISQITNLENGNSAILRGVDGRPVWGKGGGSH